ncbi:MULTISPECIES: SH3 domain-containing protein [Leptospira]|uniref:SH3 domain-containing protein n=1 Tax=Leptospira TaxID=171 RepID=UPI001082C4ED|nr:MULTISPECIES: SH3 domain-containing protein [Leptospira]TGM26176.1 SH3 domain-containing protein [Leptospira levettii]TGM74338.1 SH3 domain-containing protein [Leptospira bouyouniensis]
MKQTILILLVSTFFFSICKDKSTKKEAIAIKPIKMVVNANGGLRIRRAPDVNSEKIGLIPDGSIVDSYGEILNEMTIDGKTGKWMKIKYLDIIGYSFSGFLIHEDKFSNPIENEKTISEFRKIIPSLEDINYDSEKDKRSRKLTDYTGTVTFDSTISIYRVISISPSDQEDEFNNYNFIFKNNKLIFSDMNMQSLGLPISIENHKVKFQRYFGCATDCDEYIQTDNYEFDFLSLELIGETIYNSKYYCENKNDTYSSHKKWISNLDGTIREVIFDNK